MYKSFLSFPVFIFCRLSVSDGLLKHVPVAVLGRICSLYRQSVAIPPRTAFFLILYLIVLTCRVSSQAFAGSDT